MRDQQKYVQQNEQYKDRLARKRHDDQLGSLTSLKFYIEARCPEILNWPVTASAVSVLARIYFPFTASFGLNSIL